MENQVFELKRFYEKHLLFIKKKKKKVIFNENKTKTQNNCLFVWNFPGNHMIQDVYNSSEVSLHLF